MWRRAWTRTTWAALVLVVVLIGAAVPTAGAQQDPDPVDTSAPVLTILSPVQGESQNGRTLTVMIRAEDESDIAAVGFTLRNGGGYYRGGSFGGSYGLLGAESIGDGLYRAVLDTVLNYDEVYRMRVVARDIHGNRTAGDERPELRFFGPPDAMIAPTVEVAAVRPFAQGSPRERVGVWVGYSDTDGTSHLEQIGRVWVWVRDRATGHYLKRVPGMDPRTAEGWHFTPGYKTIETENTTGLFFQAPFHLPEGQYRIRAIGRDPGGNRSTSEPINFEWPTGFDNR